MQGGDGDMLDNPLFMNIAIDYSTVQYSTEQYSVLIAMELITTFGKRRSGENLSCKLNITNWIH